MPAISTALTLRGDLGITLRDAASGAVLRRIQIRNQICNQALAALVNLLIQRPESPAPGRLQLATLRVGTGVVPPVAGDTELGGEAASVVLEDGNRIPAAEPGVFEIMIQATLEADQAVNADITEAGLFLENGDLFARQVHPTLHKTGANVIDYDWRISFTA